MLLLRGKQDRGGIPIVGDNRIAQDIDLSPTILGHLVVLRAILRQRRPILRLLQDLSHDA